MRARAHLHGFYGLLQRVLLAWQALAVALVLCAAPGVASPLPAPGFASGAAPFTIIPPLALCAGWLLLGLAFQLPRVEGDRGGGLAGAWTILPAILSMVGWSDARAPLFLGLAFVYALFVVIWVAWDEQWRAGPKIVLGALACGTMLSIVAATAGWTMRADANECMANQREIAFALQTYAADHQGQYPDRLPQDAPRCAPPLEGAAEALRTSVYNLRSDPYGYARSRQAFTIWCGAPNHRGIGLRAGFPQYTSARREVLSP